MSNRLSLQEPADRVERVHFSQTSISVNPLRDWPAWVKTTRTLRDVIVHWRWSLVVGLSGVLASIAWFTAFTLQNAAYVRALGQIELVFTFFFSVVVFREKTSRIEVFGIMLVVAAILMLVLGR